MNASISDQNEQGMLGHFVQYMADNIDHNTGTLDGLNIFHGMGIIGVISPSFESKLVVKRRTDIAQTEVIKEAKIKINAYQEECKCLLNIKFGSLEKILTEDPMSDMDLVWKSSWLLHPDRPSWA